MTTHEEKSEVITQNDTRLRILYLYQLLSEQSDENHPLTTNQIISKMQEQHDIHMHRTTVSSDIALLKAAGFDIISERKRALNYYLADRAFSLPELKILIDAVQSSKFITENKSQLLIEKLASLTSETNAHKLKRSLHISGRAKSDNEKGYYIVDAIHDAINIGKKISFLYFDYDGKKKQVLKNNGQPYTVSPYDLIWDGDFYYLTGFCDERESVRIFRVDRIKNLPEQLQDGCIARPKGYTVKKYTQEIFRMFDTQQIVDVTMICDNSVMKSIIDRFGKTVKTKVYDDGSFQVKVKVCTGPTFYRWVFGFGGLIKIAGPSETVQHYIEMLKDETARYIG